MTSAIGGEFTAGVSAHCWPSNGGRWPLATMLLALWTVCGGCERPRGHSSTHGQTAEPPRTVFIKGSDTMVVLTQSWAEGYMETHPNCSIRVSGGGSGTGLSALLDGTTDIATVSRPIEPRERQQLHARRGVDAHEFRVAIDAIAIYVHLSNPVPSLDMRQLKALFRGDTRRWDALGGAPEPIVLYGREHGSGTHAYFREHVLGDEDFAAEAQALPGTAAVIHAVSHDRLAIGYGGIAYAHGVRTVPIVDAAGLPVAPDERATASGHYPLARSLFMVTAGAASGVVADFLAWVRSDAGQKTVQHVGFFPLDHPDSTPTPR